jgi:hypothetical protein
MAVLRITYGGGTRRQMLVEGAIFGGLTLTIISGLDFFGLPQSMSVLIDATDVAKGCGVPATSGAGGVDHADVQVQLDPAHAQQIIAITHEGDRGLIALQACQA